MAQIVHSIQHEVEGLVSNLGTCSVCLGRLHSACGQLLSVKPTQAAAGQATCTHASRVLWAAARCTGTGCHHPGYNATAWTRAVPHAVQESGTSFKYCVSSDGPPFNGQCSPNHLANPAKTGTLTDQDLTGELLAHTGTGPPVSAASCTATAQSALQRQIHIQSACDAQQPLSCCTWAQQPILSPVQHHEPAPLKALR